MTFDSLQEDVRDHLERGESVDTRVFSQIPKKINMAERAIFRQLRILGFQKVVTFDLVADQAVYPKPERWRENIALEIGTGTNNDTRVPVHTRGLEFVKAFWPDRSVTGQPRYVADYNYDNFIIAPTPDAAYPAELVFYQAPALLDDDVQTNWITEFLPAALLYRTLMEMAPFLMNDERINTWKAFYDEEMAKVDAEDVRRMADRAATRQEV